MRVPLGCVALLTLSTLSCCPKPTEPNPERLSCPHQHLLQEGEPGPEKHCRLYDTDQTVSAADLTICNPPGPPKRTVVAPATMSRFTVEYDANGVAISWNRPERPEPSALELAPPELWRVIPGLQRSVDPACLARPEVSAYLGELRDRVRGRWKPPPLDEQAKRDVVVMFSLSASGEVTGACFEPSVPDDLGASAVRALLRTAPFESMTTEPEAEYRTETKVGTTTKTKTEKMTVIPKPTECLAGRRLIGNLTVP